MLWNHLRLVHISPKIAPDQLPTQWLTLMFMVDLSFTLILTVGSEDLCEREPYEKKKKKRFGGCHYTSGIKSS